MHADLALSKENCYTRGCLGKRAGEILHGSLGRGKLRAKIQKSDPSHFPITASHTTALKQEHSTKQNESRILEVLNWTVMKLPPFVY